MVQSALLGTSQVIMVRLVCFCHPSDFGNSFVRMRYLNTIRQSTLSNSFLIASSHFLFSTLLFIGNASAAAAVLDVSTRSGNERSRREHGGGTGVELRQDGTQGVASGSSVAILQASDHAR